MERDDDEFGTKNFSTKRCEIRNLLLRFRPHSRGQEDYDWVRAKMASQATFYGVPLRLISLVILVVQNSALTILLHYASPRPLSLSLRRL